MTGGQSATPRIEVVTDVAAPGTPAPRTQPPDVRRQQLLDAAERVLLGRGLAHTTVAEVAEAAGVAKGTVYLYFGSKSELLVALRDRYLQQFAEALDVTTGSARDRIQALVLGFFEFAAKSHDLHHVLFHEAGFSEQDAFIRLRKWLVQLIADGVASGELTKTDPELAAAFVLAGMHGVLVETLHGNEGRDPDAVARQLATLVDQTLAVP
jgi:AcrR family transcriptional regulator